MTTATLSTDLATTRNKKPDVEVLNQGELSLTELQHLVAKRLVEWHDQAMALWQITSDIGRLLERAYRDIGSDPPAWMEWVEALGLNAYGAFVLMRSQRYPDLIRKHKPGSLEAISKLLPQGQGTAFDREQATLARQLHADGMSAKRLSSHLGVSHHTVSRWIDPEGYEQRQRQKRDARLRRQQQGRDELARRREAAIKAKGGPSSLAYEHIRKAELALHEAMSSATDREQKRLFRAALTALHESEDRITEGHGIS